MSNIFTLNWKDVLGAVVSSVLSAVLGYVGNLTDLSSLNIHQILSIAVIVGATSLLKALTTDYKGEFAGVIPVK